MLGVLVGTAGFIAWAYERCDLFLGTCLVYSRPFTEVGIIGMVFGGIFVVVGILILAVPGLPGLPSSQRPPPETPPLQSPPETLEGKYCPKCHTLNPLEARFCNSCANEFSG